MNGWLAVAGITIGEAYTIGSVVIAAGLVFYRLGRMSKTFDNVIENQQELGKTQREHSAAHQAHAEDDREEFRRISERLESIHVSVGRIQGQLAGGVAH